MKTNRLVGATEVLGKSLGLRSAAPKYSAEQIEHGSMAALQAGVIDSQTATAISAALALGGRASIPANIIRTLEGQE